LRQSVLISRFVDAVSTLSSLVERASVEHGREVARLAVAIGKEAGIPEDRLRDLAYAALLHDVGEVTIPDRIIDKTGRLTEDERDAVKAHPLVGYRVVSDISGLERAAAYIRWHHERIDGAGYPDRLEAESIPLEVSILQAADVFVTLRSPRPYREALSKDQALTVIQGLAGRALPSKVVQLLIRSRNSSGVSQKELDRVLIIPPEADHELAPAQGKTGLYVMAMILGQLASERHPHLKSHLLITLSLCRGFGKAISLPESSRFKLELASILHETGMVIVPSRIVRSRARLIAQDWKILKQHPYASAEVARALLKDDETEEIILSHHEHYDGTGYPRGLKGNEIPYLARILSLCSAFAALINPRSYRRALTARQALKALYQLMGTQFDPSFFKVLNEFPNISGAS
jgi:HD-GYP domain-containing protein (c-di-GMP phosphodiesterase class II)